MTNRKRFAICEDLDLKKRHANTLEINSPASSMHASGSSSLPTALPIANQKSKIKNSMRFAFRQIFKHPGFTLVAVLTLALGIGATTALFSVVYGVLISPYPYANAGGIWMPGLATAKNEQLMRPY